MNGVVVRPCRLCLKEGREVESVAGPPRGPYARVCEAHRLQVAKGIKEARAASQARGRGPVKRAGGELGGAGTLLADGGEDRASPAPPALDRSDAELRHRLRELDRDDLSSAERAALIAPEHADPPLPAPANGHAEPAPTAVQDAVDRALGATGRAVLDIAAAAREVDETREAYQRARRRFNDAIRKAVDASRGKA